MALITISRGTFSGGRAVAEKLAQLIGYPCMSRETIIRDAAELFKIPENQLSAAMIEVPTFWRQDVAKCTSNLNFVRAALLHSLKGKNLVYHGYGGHLLLKGVSRLLRVKIIACMEYRIAAAMNECDIDRKCAVAHINASDKSRAKWAKLVLGVEWGDPTLFDAVFNLDHISIDGTVQTISSMTQLAEFTPDEAALQSLEDLLVSSRVWAAITLNKATQSAKIQSEATNGCVTISGNVGSLKMMEAVIDVTTDVEGVDEVINQISIGSNWAW